MSRMALMDEMADQIRAALAAVTDITVQVEPRLVLNPTPPTIDIHPGDVGQDLASAAFGDDGGILLTVRARVTTADHDAGQDLLLEFMEEEGDLSVGQALYDDPTLNGNADDLTIQNLTGYVLFPDPGGDGALLGCQWTVLVLPSRS